ncbi:MAG TPA: phospho-sugar mutase, partial [Lachnospiraceae bacterium]|nr:phospho-sugar mutase [Lachnospiraceae bacterium]
CKNKGITLWDQMVSIYEKYGYYKEGMHTITLKGIEGAEQIKAIMEKLRQNPPTSFGELAVINLKDYETHVVTNLKTGEKSDTGLPTSNVLYFELDNDSWCCARPSGTEPKIKFYMGIKGTSLSDAEDRLKSLTDAVVALL